MKKRLTAGVLVLCMLLALMPAAFAVVPQLNGDDIYHRISCVQMYKQDESGEWQEIDKVSGTGTYRAEIQYMAASNMASDTNYNGVRYYILAAYADDTRLIGCDVQRGVGNTIRLQPTHMLTLEVSAGEEITALKLMSWKPAVDGRDLVLGLTPATDTIASLTDKSSNAEIKSIEILPQKRDVSPAEYADPDLELIQAYPVPSADKDEYVCGRYLFDRSAEIGEGYSAMGRSNRILLYRTAAAGNNRDNGYDKYSIAYARVNMRTSSSVQKVEYAAGRSSDESGNETTRWIAINNSTPDGADKVWSYDGVPFTGGDTYTSDLDNKQTWFRITAEDGTVKDWSCQQVITEDVLRGLNQNGTASSAGAGNKSSAGLDTAFALKGEENSIAANGTVQTTNGVYVKTDKAVTVSADNAAGALTVTADSSNADTKLRFLYDNNSGGGEVAIGSDSDPWYQRTGISFKVEEPAVHGTSANPSGQPVVIGYFEISGVSNTGISRVIMTDECVLDSNGQNSGKYVIGLYAAGEFLNVAESLSSNAWQGPQKHRLGYIGKVDYGEKFSLYICGRLGDSYTMYNYERKNGLWKVINGSDTYYVSKISNAGVIDAKAVWYESDALTEATAPANASEFTTVLRTAAAKDIYGVTDSGGVNDKLNPYGRPCEMYYFLDTKDGIRYCPGAAGAWGRTYRDIREIDLHMLNGGTVTLYSLKAGAAKMANPEY